MSGSGGSITMVKLDVVEAITHPTSVAITNEKKVTKNAT
jgi:hypothetical protein